jgi:diketogulonate reductase-like aldo/keto reductase
LGGLDDVDILNNLDVKRAAVAHQVSAAQVALRWVVQQKALVLTAASKASYIAQDLDLFSFSLDELEMARLSAI